MCRGERVMAKKKMSVKEMADRRIHVLYILPDGDTIGCWVFGNQTMEGVYAQLLDNWYENIKKNPKLHGHIILRKKCPKCKGELRTLQKRRSNEYYEGIRPCWCMNCRKRYWLKKDNQLVEQEKY